MPSQQVLAKLFKDLVKKSKPLLRNEKDVDYLVEKGFNEALQNESVTGFNRGVYGEPSGLFYTEKAKDIGNLIKGSPRGTNTIPPNMTAVPLPEARSKVFSPEEWQGYMGKNRLEINKELKPKYDFVSHPDLNTDQPKLYQTIQLNPNKAIAKIKTDKGSIYKILGLASALGLGSLNMQNDAEAMPLGDILKAGTQAAIKATKGPLSSAARDIEGMLLKGESIQGRTIRSVTKGGGDLRNILLDNGDVLQVDKQYINDLARAAGKSKYANKLTLEAPEDQFQQALTGLQHSYEYTYTTGKGIPRDQYTAHTERLNELLGANPDIPMVGVRFGGRYMIIPQAYADILKGQKLTLPRHPDIKGVLQIDSNPVGGK